jgi:DNA-binding protein H-NS
VVRRFDPAAIRRCPDVALVGCSVIPSDEGATMIDSALEKLSIDDMCILHEQICVVLERKLEDEQRRLQTLLDQIRRRPARTLAAIPRRRLYPRVAPKFQNPVDPSLTWSGRGRQPRWVTDLLASGKAIEELRILEAV